MDENFLLQKKRVMELLALMKREKDGVQYVSPNVGAVGNMVAEYVADKEKVKLVHIASA